MSRATKIILGIAGFLLITAAAVFFLGHRMLNKSLPDYSEDINLDILQKPVQVYTDEWGVPHIFAENEEDMFRAAGYVVASERLWQMDLMRRGATGRLSEIFGSQALETDKYLRTIGIDAIAKKIAGELSPASLAFLQLYADGVNAFIRANRSRLPVEFALLGYEPEEWKITDSIAIIRIMAVRLSYAWRLDPVLFRLANKIGLKKALEVYPDYPKDAPLIVSELMRKLDPVFGLMSERGRAVGQILGGPGVLAGSNSWVVAGSRTASGKPILANDPHLGLHLPPIWFEMHLSGGDFNAAGMHLIGTPGLVIGHNGVAAWGLTNGMIDDGDIYFERLNPENKNQYWDGKSWQPVDTRAEVIEVKGEEDPVILQVRSTPRGPIVSDVHPLFRDDTTAISYRWTGHMISDEIQVFYRLAKMQSWDDFLAALRGFVAPSQNFIYADTSGVIGYHLGGYIPIRRDGKGYLPYNAWDPAGDWLGPVPFERMPQSYMPEKNFIVTANNRMVPDNWPWYLGFAWEPASRAARITELLQQEDRIDVNGIAEIQSDVHSVYARGVLQAISKVVTNEQMPAGLRDYWRLLEQWDHEAGTESVEATLFNVFIVQLMQDVLQDEMGEKLYDEFRDWNNFPSRAVEYLVSAPRSSWWDDITTPEKEGMQDIIVRSFGQAVSWLRENYGDGPGFWEWGKIHTLTLAHPVGGQKPLDMIFNRGPYAVGGSPNSVAKAEYKLGNPFSVVAGASMRMIVDMSQPMQAHTVIPGGQSGQPMSEHYADQIELWVQGRHKIVQMDRHLVEQQAVATRTLTPLRDQ